MSDIGKSERATQNRVIALFLDELRYRLLGDWSDRVNRQIDEGLLRDWLANRGHTPEQIGRTLDLLGREANNPTRSIYDNNRAVYSLLRYGVDVRVAAGENTEKVWLIDWQNPEANDFAVAAEVTLIGAPGPAARTVRRSCESCLAALDRAKEDEVVAAYRSGHLSLTQAAAQLGTNVWSLFDTVAQRGETVSVSLED